MKKFKKLSMLLAGAMMLSCVSIMPVSAAEPAAPRMTLFSHDFEGEDVTPNLANTQTTGNITFKKNSDNLENNYGTWTMKSTYRSGYTFGEGKGVVSGKVHVSFDFMTTNESTWRQIAMGHFDFVSKPQVKLGIPLLTINPAISAGVNKEANALSVGGRYANTTPKGALVKNNDEIVIATDSTWYTYEGIIDLDKRTIDMTLKERGKDQVIGSCTTGQLALNTNEWEEWPITTNNNQRICPSPTYPCDSIAVTCGKDGVPLSLDNIEIWTERDTSDTSFKEDFEGAEPTIYDASNGLWEKKEDANMFEVGDDGGNKIGTFHKDNAKGNRIGFDIGDVAVDGTVKISFKFRSLAGTTTFVILGNEYEGNNQQHNWLGLLTAKVVGDKRYLYAGTGHGGALFVADGHTMKAPDGSDASIEDDTWYTYDALLDVDNRNLQAVVTDAEGAVVGSINFTDMKPHDGTDTNARFNDWPVITDFRMLASMYKSDLDDIDIEAEPTTPKVTAKSSDGALGSAQCEQNGLIATLTATPLNGSTFDGWYIGDGQDPVSTDLKYTVNAAALEGDTEYTAKFTAKEEPTPPPAEDVTATIAALDEKDGNTFDIGFEFEALDPSDYANIVFTVDGQTKGGTVDEVLKTVVNGPALIAIILENAPSKDAKVTFTNQDIPPVQVD